MPVPSALTPGIDTLCEKRMSLHRDGFEQPILLFHVCRRYTLLPRLWQDAAPSIDADGLEPSRRPDESDSIGGTGEAATGSVDDTSSVTSEQVDPGTPCEATCQTQCTTQRPRCPETVPVWA